MRVEMIEDAAQSYGAKYKGKRSCNLSVAAGTSFFPAKPLGCYGDGGAVFTADAQLYRAMKEIREHGSESRYYHTRLGINGRLDTIQCAILLAKLDRYEWEIEQRNRIAENYNKAFADIKLPDFACPTVKAECRSVWAQYTLTVGSRDDFQKKLTALGIPTSIHYPRIMPDQPWYKEHTAAGVTQDLGIARWAAQHVISLPLYPDMDHATQEKIIEAVRSAVR